MAQPKNWWIGLLPLLVVWCVALFVGIGPVERDLAQKARAVVADDADLVDFADVTIEGRDIGLSGQAFSPAAKAALPAKIDAIPGVRLVDDKLTQIPVAAPFGLTAAMTADGLALTGFASSRALRANLVEQARAAAPGGKVDDRLAFASGAPDRIDAAAAHGLGLLATLRNGVLSLSGPQYSISGTAPDSATFEAALAAVKQLPPGFVLARADIQPPLAKPWRFEVTADARAVVVAGQATDPAARDALMAAITASFPGRSLSGRLEIARGAPAGDYAAASRFGIGELAKLDHGAMSFEDSHLSLSGTGLDEVTAETISADAAIGLPKGFDLAANQVIAAPASPFTLTVVRQENGLKIDGYAPSGAARASLLDAARGAVGPNGELISSVKVASGLPAGVDYLSTAVFAIRSALRMQTGAVALSGAALDIQGQVAGQASAAAFRDALSKNLPPGATLARNEIVEAQVRPWLFRAARIGNRLVLGGYVPDEATRTALREEIGRRFFDVTLDDQTDIGRGAPADFATGARVAIAGLARMSAGETLITDNRLTVSGLTFYPKATAQLTEEMSKFLPSGFIPQFSLAPAPALPPVDAAGCQPLLGGVLEKGRILFETGKADIDRVSAGVLDRLVNNVQRCAGLRIEVSGHTDSTGSSEANQLLSEQRAAAVVAWLVEAGIAPEALIAAGYGATRPLASNDDAEGRARNRRIEFLVK